MLFLQETLKKKSLLLFSSDVLAIKIVTNQNAVYIKQEVASWISNVNINKHEAECCF